MPGQPVTTVAGVVLTVAGVAFSLSGVGAMIGHHTTVVPHHPVARLVITGPYRISRNPMYAGHVVAYLGVALWVGTWWPLIALPVCVLANQPTGDRRRRELPHPQIRRGVPALSVGGPAVDLSRPTPNWPGLCQVVERFPPRFPTMVVERCDPDQSVRTDLFWHFDDFGDAPRRTLPHRILTFAPKISDSRFGVRVVGLRGSDSPIRLSIVTTRPPREEWHRDRLPEHLRRRSQRRAGQRRPHRTLDGNGATRLATRHDRAARPGAGGPSWGSASALFTDATRATALDGNTPRTVRSRHLPRGSRHPEKRRSSGPTMCFRLSDNHPGDHTGHHHHDADNDCRPGGVLRARSSIRRSILQPVFIGS